MDKIIQVKKISKKYDLNHQKGGYVSARDVIADAIKNPLGIVKKNTHEPFWALKDVTFDVLQGEALGVIGSNGSGKSTLLKVMTKITPPTEGEIVMRGKISSLLEVGTGFHPELSGRENIFLNGAILGMSQKEIRRKFSEIVNFSGVEKFMDTPVKHFSSGMYVRLAFAVAAHLEPDILLVDEVLAVGDIEFQKKCLGKMDEVTRTEGRTVLFVSHNMNAIQNLCSKCIYLDKGELKAFGKTKDVIDLYLKSTLENGIFLKDRQDRKYKTPLKLTAFHIEHNGKRVTFLESGKDYDFCYSYESEDSNSLNNVSLWSEISHESGAILIGLNTNYTNQNFKTLPAKGTVKCTIKNLPLTSGYYQFSAVIKSEDKIDIIRQAGSLEVRSGKFFGHEISEERGQVFVNQNWQFKD